MSMSQTVYTPSIQTPACRCARRIVERVHSAVADGTGSARVPRKPGRT